MSSVKDKVSIKDYLKAPNREEYINNKYFVGNLRNSLAACAVLPNIKERVAAFIAPNIKSGKIPHDRISKITQIINQQFNLMPHKALRPLTPKADMNLEDTIDKIIENLNSEIFKHNKIELQRISNYSDILPALVANSMNTELNQTLDLSQKSETQLNLSCLAHAIMNYSVISNKVIGEYKKLSQKEFKNHVVNMSEFDFNNEELNKFFGITLTHEQIEVVEPPFFPINQFNLKQEFKTYINGKEEYIFSPETENLGEEFGSDLTNQNNLFSLCLQVQDVIRNNENFNLTKATQATKAYAFAMTMLNLANGRISNPETEEKILLAFHNIIHDQKANINVTDNEMINGSIIALTELFSSKLKQKESNPESEAAAADVNTEEVAADVAGEESNSSSKKHTKLGTPILKERKIYKKLTNKSKISSSNDATPEKEVAATETNNINTKSLKNLLRAYSNLVSDSSASDEAVAQARNNIAIYSNRFLQECKKFKEKDDIKDLVTDLFVVASYHPADRNKKMLELQDKENFKNIKNIGIRFNAILTNVNKELENNEIETLKKGEPDKEPTQLQIILKYKNEEKEKEFINELVKGEPDDLKKPYTEYIELLFDYANNEISKEDLVSLSNNSEKFNKIIFNNAFGIANNALEKNEIDKIKEFSFMKPTQKEEYLSKLADAIASVAGNKDNISQLKKDIKNIKPADITHISFLFLGKLKILSPIIISVTEDKKLKMKKTDLIQNLTTLKNAIEEKQRALEISESQFTMTKTLASIAYSIKASSKEQLKNMSSPGENYNRENNAKEILKQAIEEHQMNINNMQTEKPEATNIEIKSEETNQDSKKATVDKDEQIAESTEKVAKKTKPSVKDNKKADAAEKVSEPINDSTQNNKKTTTTGKIAGKAKVVKDEKKTEKLEVNSEKVKAPIQKEEKANKKAKASAKEVKQDEKNETINTSTQAEQQVKKSEEEKDSE